LEESGDNDVIVMITLHDCDIGSLTYDRSDAEKDSPFSRGDRNPLHIFTPYVFYCDSIGHPMGIDWLYFDDFQVSLHCLVIVRGSAPPPPVPTTTTAQNV